MKTLSMLLLALLIPFMVLAQQNEPLNKYKKTNKAAKKGNGEQVFLFPDHIKFSKKELNAKVEMKTKELTKYLTILAGKKDPNYRDQIEKAMKLFNNDDRKLVMVTSLKNPEPVTKPVRQYLNDLAQLRYDKVSIVWHNAEYVSNFTKQPNGTYTALVAYEQEFTGTKGGEVNYTYHDVTQKRIEVTVKVWDEVKNGVVTKSYMDVFLGNIGVTQEQIAMK